MRFGANDAEIFAWCHRKMKDYRDAANQASNRIANFPEVKR